jgi:hypothetical protein
MPHDRSITVRVDAKRISGSISRGRFHQTRRERDPNVTNRCTKRSIAGEVTARVPIVTSLLMAAIVLLGVVADRVADQRFAQRGLSDDLRRR